MFDSIPNLAGGPISEPVKEAVPKTVFLTIHRERTSGKATAVRNLGEGIDPGKGEEEVVRVSKEILTPADLLVLDELARDKARKLDIDFVENLDGEPRVSQRVTQKRVLSATT